jgi:hypothetical protein
MYETRHINPSTERVNYLIPKTIFPPLLSLCFRGPYVINVWGLDVACTEVSQLFQCTMHSQWPGLIGQNEDVVQYTGHNPHFHP